MAARSTRTRPSTSRSTKDPVGTGTWRAALGVVVLAAVALPALFEAQGRTANAGTTRLVGLGAVALVAVWIASVIIARERRVVVPRHASVIAAAVVLVLAVVAAVVADVTDAALLGPLMRGTGLVMYASCAVLFFVAVALLDATWVRRLVVTIGLLAVFTAVYGLLQLADLDPVSRADYASPVRGTLGNPNFGSAFMGIAAPGLLWLALRDDLGLRLRAVIAVALVTTFATAVVTGSVQGPAVALGGSLPVLGVVLWERTTRPRFWLGALAAGVGLGLGGFLLGLAGAGPLTGVAAQATTRERLWYWDAAVSMVRDQPISGVGMGMYEHIYRAVRPPEQIEIRGTGLTSDSAHSVHLQMFAEGGLPLGLAYLALVVAVLAAAVVGLLRLQGRQRLLLAAVTGMWLAYQAQSAISIDVPQLAVLGWLLAAAVVVLATQGQQRWVLGAAEPPRRRRRGRGSPVPTVVGVLTGAVAVAGLVALSIPYRADAAAFDARALADQGQPDEAVDALDRVVELLPARGEYWFQRAEVLGELGDTDEAYESSLEAWRRNPYLNAAVSIAAQLAATTGEDDKARELWDHLWEIDPHNVGFLSNAAALPVGRRARDRDRAPRALGVGRCGRRGHLGAARSGLRGGR